jgi:glycosyltransferase involved in cell wall biosynthesis
MRITFLLPGLDLSGGVRVVATYAEALSRLGHHVVIVHSAPRPHSLRDRARSLIRDRRWLTSVKNRPSHLDGRGIETREVPFGRPIGDADLPDADVVVATWWETAEWAARLASRKGAKAYFIQGHEAAFTGQPAARIEATYRLPFHRITISRWLSEILRDKHGLKELVVVPNGVDLEQFHAPPRSKQATPTLGFVYSRFLLKGCDIMLSAIELARKEIPSIALSLFGSDSPGPPYLLPAGTSFVTRPRPEQLRDLYARCDAWLFASRSEGYGLPLVEALACRTPIIGTPVGAAPELVDAGGGLLVRAEDPADMSRAILRICRMPPEEWTALSERAHTIAAARSWASSITLMEQALQAIAAQGPGVPSPSPQPS